MVTFYCSGCGHQYDVPDNYVGKKVRCKKCNTINRIIPVPEVFEEPEGTSPAYTIQSGDTSDSEYRGLPKPLLYSFIGLGIVLISIFLYVFVFRDTWELDNSLKISQMIREAKQDYDFKKYDEGLKKYEELGAFIGKREFKQDGLRHDYLDLTEKYEQIKAQKAEADDLKLLQHLEELGNEYMNNYKLKEAVETYDKALAIIDRNRSGNKEFLLAKQRINQVKPKLDQLYTTIKEEEAYEQRMIDKGYIKFRGEWMSPEKYNQEKNRFPAKEIRQGIERYYSNHSTLHDLQSIQIKRSDDLEYTYAIEVAISSTHRRSLSSEPDRAIYTLRVDDDLNISKNYTVRGNSIFSEYEIDFLVDCLQTVLSEITSSEQ